MFGVGFVVREFVERRLLGQIEQRVVADDDLFEFALGMLNDVDRIAHQDFSFRTDQRTVAEARQRQPVRRARLDRDQREIKVFVGEEERVRLEAEPHDRKLGAAIAELEIEFGHAAPGEILGSQHVVVGHQQRWRHHEAGAEATLTATQIGNDAAHRAARDGALFEKADGEEIARRTDHALEEFVGHRFGGDGVVLHQFVQPVRQRLLRQGAGDLAGQKPPRPDRPFHRIQQAIGTACHPLRGFRLAVFALVDRRFLDVALLLARLEVLGRQQRDVGVERRNITWSAHSSLPVTFD